MGLGGMNRGSTRRFVALLACVASLLACTSTEPPANASPELWSDFTDKPDADTLPVKFDSGQPAIAAFDQPTAAAFIEGGAYTFRPQGSSRGASYYQGQLSGIVNRVRIQFSWAPGDTTGGVMAFAILHEPQIGTRIPSMSAHLTVSSTDWNYGIWDGPNNGDTRLKSVGYGRFNPPLSIGVDAKHEVDVSITGDTATLIVDGTQMPPIVDSRIGDSSFNGPHIFFECFSTVADTDNRTRFWKVEAWSTGKR